MNWHVEPAKPGRWGAIEVVSGEKIVCEVMNQGNLEATVSTARLIASAPNMLDALVGIYNERSIKNNKASEYALIVEDIARKAIAKATGETA